MDLTKLDEEIRTGDYTSIAKIVGCSYDTARSVIKGRRAANTIQSRKVLTVAKAIVKQRQEFEQKLEQETKNAE